MVATTDWRWPLSLSCVHSVMMVFSAQLAEGWGGMLSLLSFYTPPLFEFHRPIHPLVTTQQDWRDIATCILPYRPCPLLSGYNYRVHTEWQLSLSGVHSVMMEKLAQTGEGWACTPTPFIISTITYKVVLYAPAERADTLPLFYSTPLCTL
jgi:hypothetical protein